MRETIRSLRLYLILSGVLGTVANVLSISSGSAPLPAMLFAIAGIAASVGLLYTGLRLPYLLSNRPTHALAVVHFNMGVAAVALVVVLAFGGLGLGILQLLFGLLVLWYIRANMRRLTASESAEAAAA